MSGQDRPRKGPSGNAETVSGHAGTSGGSGVSQDLSVAESARPAPDLAGIRARLARWETLIAEQDRLDASDDPDEWPFDGNWQVEQAITEAMLDLAHDVHPLMWANAQLTAERNRARDLAVALEAQLGRVQALHAGVGKDENTAAWRVNVTSGGGISFGDRVWKWCPECRTEWPCPTTLAISQDGLQ